LGNLIQNSSGLSVPQLRGSKNKCMEEQQCGEVLYDFGGALKNLKAGNRMARKGWNGKDMYIELQVPDENSKMTLPYIYMKTVQGDLVPWLASQTDMLSDDWQLVD